MITHYYNPPGTCRPGPSFTLPHGKSSTSNLGIGHGPQLITGASSKSHVPLGTPSRVDMCALQVLLLLILLLGFEPVSQLWIARTMELPVHRVATVPAAWCLEMIFILLKLQKKKHGKCGFF